MAPSTHRCWLTIELSCLGIGLTMKDCMTGWGALTQTHSAS
jgi:hypothetical protein